MLAIAAAALLGLLALWLLRAGRPSTRDPRFSLPGVGPVSTITMLVAGVACALNAYQLIAHSFDLEFFRAPYVFTVGAGALAVLASLGVDALDNPPPGDDDQTPTA